MRKHKAKLGVIIPSCNTVLEPEFYQMIHGHDLSVHITRIKMTEDTKEQIENLIKEVPKAASLLKDADVDIIAFGCTAGSFIKGISYDKEITSLIEKETCIPATTASTSVVKALKELSLSKISIVTPYEPWLNERLVNFLADNGVEVVAIKGLGIRKDISKIPSNRILNLIKEVDTQESCGFFISCTDLRSAELIDVIEQKFKKTVVTSNQALLWNMLHTLDLKAKINGYGKLLQFT